MTDLLRAAVGPSAQVTSLPAVIPEAQAATTQPMSETVDSSPPMETAVRSSREDWAEDAMSLTRRISNSMVRRRWGSLLTFLAHLEGVPFDEAAHLLGTSSGQLAKYVRAEQSLPKSMFNKVVRIDEIIRNVLGVLDSSAIAEWLVTPIPDLNGRTPTEAILHRRAVRVLEVARSYNQPNPYS